MGNYNKHLETVAHAEMICLREKVIGSVYGAKGPNVSEAQNGFP